MNDSDDSKNEGSSFSPVADAVKAALEATRHSSFAPGFENRAWARWDRERTTSSDAFAFIERRAWQVLPLAMAASLLLAVYSLQRNIDPNATVLARALGWQSAVGVGPVGEATPDTFDTMYTSIYGLSFSDGSSGAR